MPAVEVPKLADPVEVRLARIHDPQPVKPPSKLPPATEIPLKQIQYTRMVVAPADHVNIEPPSQLDISTSVVSSVTTNGADAKGLDLVEIPQGVAANAGAVAPSDSDIFSVDAIQKYPEFPGGQDAFIKFLRKNLRYPGMAAENGIQGKVILSFIIEKNGNLSQIKVIRGIGSGCDQEAVRVLSRSPQWDPGIQNNQPVRVAYTLPINFSLSN